MPPVVSTWGSRWKSPSEVERAFSPSNWGYAAAHVTRSYTADCPTLSQYADRFGSQYAADWVHIQVLALFGSSSSASRGVADGIPLFCSAFAAETGRYKLSEMMVFFARYKAGRYDRSFTAFDCRRIGNAFFREFLPERREELFRIEMGRQKQRRNEEEMRLASRLAETVPEGYNSFTWFLHCKRQRIIEGGGRRDEGYFDAFAGENQNKSV